MQENNFEKEVQQKMEELSFTPSAPVWQKVELQIRKDKDRRRFILWLFPLLLLGGGLLWYLAKPIAVHPAAQTPATQKTKAPAPPQIDTDNNVVTNNKKEKTLLPGKTNAVGTVKVTNQSHPIKRTNENERFSGNRKEKTTEKRDAVALSGAGSYIQPSDLAIITGPDKAAAKKAETENRRADNKAATADTTAIQTEKANVTILESDVALKDNTVANLPQDTTTATPAITTEKPNTEEVVKKEKKASKWQWDIRAGVGVANQVAGIFDNFGAMSDRDVFASPVNNSTGGASMPGAAFAGPSQPQRGLSYTLGVRVKHKAGQRSFFTAGLQYSYYTTRLSVGRYVRDSAIAFNNVVLENRYYLNNSRQSTHTNRYHFIELPIGFQYQLFKNLPLQLHHGISFGYLVASNAMYYDNRVNVYYNNKDIIRKGSFNFMTSADYRLWRGHQFSIYAGPYLQYGMRTLYKAAANNGGHLISAGFSTRISF